MARCCGCYVVDKLPPDVRGHLLMPLSQADHSAQNKPNTFTIAYKPSPSNTLITALKPSRPLLRSSVVHEMEGLLMRHITYPTENLTYNRTSKPAVFCTASAGPCSSYPLIKRSTIAVVNGQTQTVNKSAAHGAPGTKAWTRQC